MLGVNLSIPAIAAASRPFSPALLFASGEQGVWYDPSDFSTMFQDSAGTIPVTAVEQPVGRILDKSGRGNHASQSTAGAQPVISARVNLLTYSEDISNAAWTKFGVASFTSSTVVLNAGTNNYVYYSYGGGGPEAASYIQSAVLSGSGTIAVGFYDGTAWRGTTFALTATPTRYSFTGTAVGRIQQVGFGVISGIGGTSGQTFTITAIDIRVTNDGASLPVYQRIAAATDYDTSRFPRYLRFDGVDDGLATSSIDFSGTNKISLFAGVRKLSDATGFGTIVELSTSTGQVGSFGLFAPSGTGTATYHVASARSATSSLDVSTFASPITNILAVSFDNAGASRALAIVPRVNGGTPTISGGINVAPGAGAFGAWPLFIGRRNGASLPFNGRIFSLIVRGAQSTDVQIASAESWLNGNTRAF